MRDIDAVAALLALAPMAKKQIAHPRIADQVNRQFIRRKKLHIGGQRRERLKLGHEEEAALALFAVVIDGIGMGDRNRRTRLCQIGLATVAGLTEQRQHRPERQLPGPLTRLAQQHAPLMQRDHADADPHLGHMRCKFTVAPLREDQRFCARRAVFQHFADQDHMITGINQLVTRTGEGGGRAVDQRQACQSLMPCKPRETVADGRCETMRHLLLITGQDIDRKMAGRAEGRETGRGLARTDQQQRRIKRDRGEGIGGKSNRAPPGVACGDNGHAGRKSTERLAQCLFPGKRRLVRL